MTDNEIIKALEYCRDSEDCIICPYIETTDMYCEDKLRIDVINLLYRQKAEIEKLKDELADARYLNTVAESDGIKEFADELKNFAYPSRDWSHGEHPCVVEVEDIDNLVKDMAGKNAFERSKAE